jgi:hypothetical protein
LISTFLKTMFGSSLSPVLCRRAYIVCLIYVICVCYNQKIGEQNNIKVVLGASKPKGLNRIAKYRLRSPIPEGGEP